MTYMSWRLDSQLVTPLRCDWIMKGGLTHGVSSQLTGLLGSRITRGHGSLEFASEEFSVCLKPLFLPPFLLFSSCIDFLAIPTEYHELSLPSLMYPVSTMFMSSHSSKWSQPARKKKPRDLEPQVYVFPSFVFLSYFNNNERAHLDAVVGNVG